MNQNWDLSVLYDSFDDPRLAGDIRQTKERMAGFERFIAEADSRGTKAEALLEIIAEIEQIILKGYTIANFIRLTLAVDATNEQALKLISCVPELDMEMKLCLSSTLTKYLVAIPSLGDVIAQDERLADFAFILGELRDSAEHKLPDEIEMPVLSMQLTGGSAFSQLYDTVVSTHTVELEKDGELKRIPLPAARGMAYSQDAAERKAAYEAELASYPKIEQQAAACLNAIKGEAHTLAKLRKFDEPLDLILYESRLDKQTLEAMLEAMRETLPKFREYLRAKAKLLGHEGALPFYDLFAPVGNLKRTFTFEESKEFLIGTLGKFSEEMADFLRRAYDERWMDAPMHEGKQGGAFCSYLPEQKQSRVMLNHDGSLTSVGTIAHELGHAYHGNCMYKRSALNMESPMCLAETASIFNETLFSHELLLTATDEDRLTLLENSLTEATQVVVDIMSRYIFESNVFAVRKQRGLTVPELKEAMLDAQKQTYGDGLDENFLHPYMWVCKTHYYFTGAHFYNWPYAFGLLFGKGVYEKYLEMGDAFVPVYRELLSSTGMGTVKDVAASVGIDVTDIGFWRKALSGITKNVDEFVKLVG